MGLDYNPTWQRMLSYYKCESYSADIGNSHLSLAHPHVNAQDDELVHEAMKRMYHADLDSIPDEHMWIFKALGIISPDSKIPEARASKQSPPIQNIFAVQTTPVSQTKHVVKSEPQTHELAKPWVCDFCPKAYYKQWSRDIHMKTHQKGHLCPFCPTEGPSKEYTDFTILQCHIGNKHSNVFRRDPRIIALITKMREGLESRFGRYQKDGLGDWFWKGNQEEGAGAELGKQVEQQTEKNSDFNQGQKRKRVDEDVGANHDKHVVKQEETEKDADVQHVKKQKTVDEGVGTDSVEQGEQQTETDADVTLAKKIKTENEW
ncbi:hypothetical protein EDC01DRAFT_642726 [Geopyxis carbonaria]|nr:hypothetical protein EDC01DRAFT_642726 [Geopyxis carbonaria]